LNQLILNLREDYRGTREYKKIYRKNSFDNWDLAIDTLESWGILAMRVAVLFRELKDIRNRTIHFNPEADTDGRELALSAIKKLTDIITRQFGGFGKHAWFIPGTPGESYIKKSWESNPFIKKIYLPNCAYVGPRHKIIKLHPRVVIKDDSSYEDSEISDSEFSKLRKETVKHGQVS
jgi:hypothetical protein